jgi:transcriptional regulator with XRE-family HTH domain
MTQSFGEKIRTLRKDQGLTLDQLAEKTESSKSYIWELENKNPPRPSAEKIAKIAAVLGVTSDYLMDDKDQNKESAEDLAFFRKYREIDPDTKERVRQMLDLIIKK